MFDDDFSLNDVKTKIIDLNITPEVAIKDIIAFLHEKYGADEEIATINHGQNPMVSKKMNFYVHDNIWYIRVRKDQHKEFAYGDFAVLNFIGNGNAVNKLVFSVETKSNCLAPIVTCSMHERRLNEKVSDLTEKEITSVNLKLAFREL